MEYYQKFKFITLPSLFASLMCSASCQSNHSLNLDDLCADPSDKILAQELYEHSQESLFKGKDSFCKNINVKSATATTLHLRCSSMSLALFGENAQQSAEKSKDRALWVKLAYFAYMNDLENFKKLFYTDRGHRLVWNEESPFLHNGHSTNRKILHYAAMGNSVKIVQLLLSEGMTKRSRDYWGNLAYSYASHYGYHQCAQMLKPEIEKEDLEKW